MYVTELLSSTGNTGRTRSGYYMVTNDLPYSLFLLAIYDLCKIVLSGGNVDSVDSTEVVCVINLVTSLAGVANSPLRLLPAPATPIKRADPKLPVGCCRFHHIDRLVCFVMMEIPQRLNCGSYNSESV